MSVDISPLLSGQHATLVGVVFGATTVVKQVAADFFRTRLGQRLLPLVPLVLGVLGAFSGLADAATNLDRTVIGLVSGLIASHSFKVGRTTVMGRGTEAPPESDGGK